MKKYKLKLDIEGFNLQDEEQKMDEKVENLVLLVYNIFEFLSDEHYI